MREIAETLQLDLEFVARDMAFHRGAGIGYLAQTKKTGEKTPWDSLAFAATSFRRAGAHALLLDNLQLAREMFTRSAECYAQLQRPYAAMMWSLARNLDSASRFSEERLSEFEIREGRLPTERSAQLIYSLLLETVVDRSPKENLAHEPDHRFRRVWQELDAFSASSVGMIGMPMASYLRLAITLQGDQSSENVLSSLLPFLNAYDLAFETARSKAYHWRRLLMPFHPVEPDTLSVFAVADKWLRKHKARAMDFVRERSDSRLAANLLAQAIEAVED